MARRSEDSLNTVVGTSVILFFSTLVVLLFVVGQNKGRLKDKVTNSADFRQLSGLRKGSVIPLAGIEIGPVTDR